MNRDIEIAFCPLSAFKSVGSNEDRDRWKPLSEHQRLVARGAEIGNDFLTVGYDGHAINRTRASVTAAEDRRAFAVSLQQLADMRDDRRLAGPTDTQVADADDRSSQLVLSRRVACIPATPPRGRSAVHGAEHAQNQ